MEKICKNCKWFNPELTSSYEARQFDGKCKLTGSLDIYPEYPQSKAVVFDPSAEWGTYLVVKEDFGCNQFEVKK